MIYNLVQYLRTEFPTETIYINSATLIAGQTEIPDRIVIVRSTGGTEKPWLRYSEPTIQILTRDNNSPASEKLARDIYNKITSRFGLILPAIIIGSTTYPAIQTAQISAIQLPYLLDIDENRRTEYVTNYKIILEEGD